MGGGADKTNHKCELRVLIFRLLLRRKKYNIGLQFSNHSLGFCMSYSYIPENNNGGDCVKQYIQGLMCIIVSCWILPAHLHGLIYTSWAVFLFLSWVITYWDFGSAGSNCAPIFCNCVAGKMASPILYRYFSHILFDNVKYKKKCSYDWLQDSNFAFK